MLIMCLDTETTGFIPKNLQLDANTESKFPYILQLSWIVYNTVTKTSTENDFILTCPIRIQNSDIHGITEAMSANGYDFSEIIDIFLSDVKSCDVLVLHNAQYDFSILEIELFRINREEDTNLIFNKKLYDTMLNSKDVLQISGKYGCYKYPKLSELYIYFFGEMFPDSHNALADVHATLRCYLTLILK